MKDHILTFLIFIVYNSFFLASYRYFTEPILERHKLYIGYKTSSKLIGNKYKIDFCNFFIPICDNYTENLIMCQMF